MKTNYLSALGGAALLICAFPAYAQDVPLPVARVSEPAKVVLPANTEVLLRMNQMVTTKGKTWSEGDSFDLSVVHDVTYGDYVVIPKGSRAVGRITWLTNKGAFGKSGKMDVEMEYLEIAGRRINLNGTYRQEGEGNTVATVGGVILAGVFAGFITGKSGTIPQGRELMAHTESDIPLAISEPVTAPVGLPVRPSEPMLVQASATVGASAPEVEATAGAETVEAAATELEADAAIEAVDAAEGSDAAGET